MMNWVLKRMNCLLYNDYFDANAQVEKRRRRREVKKKHAKKMEAEARIFWEKIKRVAI